MADGVGANVTYGYDTADRLTAVGRAGQQGFAYRYDPDGNLVSRTYPDVTVVSAGFDRDGRLVALSEGGRAQAFTYDAAGRLIAATSPDGIDESRTYDRAGRLTLVRNDGPSGVLSQFDRTFDAVGNPTRIDTTRGGATTSEVFDYDPADRLTQWCQGTTCAGATASIGYTYDPVGNRLTQTRTGLSNPGVTNYSYDNADQLTGTSGAGGNVSYTYDPLGNMTAQGATTFTYDLASRMTSTTTGGVVTGYRYDGDSKRVDRSTNGTVDTRYVWDQANDLSELVAEQNAAGTVQRRYVHGPTGPAWMSTPTGQFSPDTHHVYHRDLMGSVTDLTTIAGASVATYTYEPFGAELSVTAGAPANPLRFTGEYLDTETQDYHLRARQYDPATGRFGATDPVTPPMNRQWVNPYAYANQMPGVYTDPSGNFVFLAPAVPAVAGVATVALAAAGTYLSTHQEDVVNAVQGFGEDVSNALAGARDGTLGFLSLKGYFRRTSRHGTNCPRSGHGPQRRNRRLRRIRPSRRRHTQVSSAPHRPTT